MNGYKDFERLPGARTMPRDDIDIRNNDGNTITVSTRSKSQYVKQNNSGTQLNQIDRQKRLRESTGQDNKARHEEQLNEVLAMYDKHFLEYNTNEIKLGKSKKDYKNVDFSQLNALDFETNKLRVQEFLEEIIEEDEIPVDENNRSPVKSKKRYDIELI